MSTFLKLNSRTETKEFFDEYRLNPFKKYVIDIEDEYDSQIVIFESFIIMGCPPAYKNYKAWLFENGFDPDSPNPTVESVKDYYGVKPLWKTAYSQGIVVKDNDEEDPDYYIVMECSSLNRGFKHTEVLLTLGGCI